MDENCNMTKHFADIETSRGTQGYFHSVGEALTIVVPAHPEKRLPNKPVGHQRARQGPAGRAFRHRKGAVLLMAAALAEARRA